MHRLVHRLARTLVSPLVVALICSLWLPGSDVVPTTRAQALPTASPEAIDPRSLVDPVMAAWLAAPLEMPGRAESADPDGSPIRMRIFEMQFDVETQTEFTHYAYRIETEAGLQQAGQISVDFAPSYQTVRWHFLRIWRDGRPREMLDASRIQILRQEENAERYLYHGRLSALTLLHDLRVGDEVEFAYTRTGENPVFAGRFSKILSGSGSAPIDRLRYHLRGAPGRALHVATLGDFEATHETTENSGREIHMWNASRLVAIHPLGDAPAHEVQFPCLQITEYGSWPEVREWARDLFRQADQPAPELAERALAIVADANTVEEKANRLLRFVQDDIRYVGLQIRESSHRPAPPAQVLDRRFGDCKDKSLLLVSLLRQVGVRAEVALVNSAWGRGLAARQSSPLAFDHAIVRVRKPARKNSGAASSFAELRFSASFNASGSVAPPADEYLWLDPTLSLQGGRFDERYVPDYGFALPLENDFGELFPVESPLSARSVIIVRDRYTVPDYTNPAELEVVTTYRGSSADAYRYYRGVVDPERNTRELTAFLERFYPKVKSLGVIKWEDNREANVLVSRARFELPDFWTTDAKAGQRRIEVYPWALSQRLPRPETTERIASFALPHPADWSQESTINLPKEWPDHQEARTIDDDSFEYSYETETKGRLVNLSYRWRTLADSVPAAHMPAWAAKMNELRGTFGYQLQQNIRLVEAMRKGGPVRSLSAAVAAGLLAGLALGVAAYRWKPAELPGIPVGDRHLAGIGGWLLLLAVNVAIRPFVLMAECGKMLPLLQNRANWIALTDAESSSYNAGFAPLAWTEFFVAGLFVSWSIVAIVQFFGRKASAPRTLLVSFTAGLAWMITDIFWSAAVLGDKAEGETAAQIGRTMGTSLGTIIWIAYLLTSRRVRATFRK